MDLGERPGVRSGESAELSKARARIRDLEAELELTRTASVLFSEVEDRPAPKRIYPVIVSLAGQGHSAKACCRLLDVAPSGFFYWRGRPLDAPSRNWVGSGATQRGQRESGSSSCPRIRPQSPHAWRPRHILHTGVSKSGDPACAST